MLGRSLDPPKTAASLDDAAMRTVVGVLSRRPLGAFVSSLRAKGTSPSVVRRYDLDIESSDGDPIAVRHDR